MLEIPGYRIIEKIGRSSMTTVWKAYQSSLERYVTIKVLKDEFADDPQETERFFAEAKQTSALKHPGILQIFDADVYNGQYFVVMEHISGPTLDVLIHEKGPLPPKWSMGVAAQVARALGYAWNRHSLIHRNLTPRSVFVGGQYVAKLAYLGLSLRVKPTDGETRIRPGMIVGTPYYMSPEQACCSPDLDFRADMYSLGATLYHMVTGTMPFGKHDPMQALRCQMEDELPHPCQDSRSIPPGIGYVIRKLMMKDPVNRYADWREASLFMEKLAAGKVLVSGGTNGHRSTVRDIKTVSRANAGPRRSPARPRRQLAHMAHPRLRRILA